MAKWLKNLLVRWMVYRKGIRFYATETVPKSESFKAVEFANTHGVGVEFFFFREESRDIIYKRGMITRERFVGYVIQARFEEHYPETLRSFNNMKFFFNTKEFVAVEEDRLLPILLDIYLDFIKQEMLAAKQ